jgi:uncharacterized protein (TIGR03083 family)
MAPATRDTVIDAIRASHTRLASALDGVADVASQPSYCADWSIGQVVSHLGSGAEIYVSILDAGANGRSAPETAQFQPIWDRWNALSPDEQTRRGVESDRALLDRIDALTEAERDSWRLDLFGAERDLEGFARLRLSEHVMHTWDVVVALQPSAVLDGEAASLILDQLGWVAGFVGRPADEPTTVRLIAGDLGRAFLLDIGTESVTLTEKSSESEDSDNPVDGRLALPAEAMVRLVFGRLDPDHTPAFDASGVDLDFLRERFPGL